EWYDKHKKYHKEEIVDVFIDNKKLARGMCGRIIVPIIKIKKNEAKLLTLNDKSFATRAV
ncbi:MAG: hypothetical protein DRI84_05585, partial [Bacteroidetes bacterium]